MELQLITTEFRFFKNDKQRRYNKICALHGRQGIQAIVQALESISPQIEI